MFLFICSFDFFFETHHDIVAKHLCHLFQAEILSLRKEEVDSEPQSNRTKNEDKVEFVTDVSEGCWCRLQETYCS